MAGAVFFIVKRTVPPGPPSGPTNMSSLTTTDPESKLSVTVNQVTVNGVDRVDNIYGYKFMGERANRFTVRMSVTPRSGIEFGGTYQIFSISDQGLAVNELRTARDGMGVFISRHPTGGGLVFTLENYRPYATDTDTYMTTYVADTTYYLEIERLTSRLGGMIVRIYSDSDYTNLLDTLTKVYNWAHYMYFGHSSANITGDQTIYVDFSAWDVTEWISCDDGWDKYNGYVYVSSGGGSPHFSFDSVGISDTKILNRLNYNTTLTAMIGATPYASIRHAPNKKIYFEVELTTGNPAVCYIGYMTERAEWSSDTHHAPGGGSDTGLSYMINGTLNSYGNVQTGWGDTYGEGDVIGVALDLTDAINGNGKAWFSKNGVWQASGDPVSGINPAKSDIDIANGDTLVPSVAVRTASTFRLRYTVLDPVYNKPAGYAYLQSPLLPIST